MERSRNLTLTDWTKANDALHKYFEGNKSKLAKHLDMSRTSVTNFFKQRPVRDAEFRKICLSLRLNWQEVSSGTDLIQLGRDDFFEQAKSRCREIIFNWYREIQLLGSDPIEVDKLYVKLDLSKQLPSTRLISQNKMLEEFNLRNNSLGPPIRCESDLDVVRREPKLLILGRPGSGKTTLLKYLALNWCKQKIFSDLIAVFIEFRNQNSEWSLFEEICRQISGKTYDEEIGDQDKESARKWLNAGKLLVLMDGFDEVPTDLLRQKIQRQIRDLAKTFHRNRFIITCRTQISEIKSTLDGFTEVQLSDFNEAQVERFVRNWFGANREDASNVEVEWQKFSDIISHNAALKELTATPVLLGLMCLVLQHEGEIPAERNSLYERGVELLLQKWNKAKSIEKWEIGTETYRNLNINQKKKLLMEIAAKKFEDPNNFVLFDEEELVDQIQKALNCLTLDGRSILEAIETQHGLLVERADKLWSFSHLTFQEYFTTQWLIGIPPEILLQKITNPEWQNIVKRLVAAQGQFDRLLKLIKKAIDRSINSS